MIRDQLIGSWPASTVDFGHAAALDRVLAAAGVGVVEPDPVPSADPFSDARNLRLAKRRRDVEEDDEMDDEEEEDEELDEEDEDLDDDEDEDFDEDEEEFDEEFEDEDLDEDDDIFYDDEDED